MLKGFVTEAQRHEEAQRLQALCSFATLRLSGWIPLAALLRSENDD
jgi:hypothetical protein